MSRLITNAVRHTGASADAFTLDSGGGITFEKPPAKGRQVLEQFYSPCDGSTITTSQGDITLTNVTAAQNLTTTHEDITGSSISYNPPTGTTQVIYEFQFSAGPGDALPVMHFKFNVDGTDVTYSRHSTYLNGTEVFNHFKWGVNIGGSTTAATGRLASWSGAKTLKMMAREYSSAHEGTVHQVFHWDGSTTGVFHQPCIGITAIG